MEAPSDYLCHVCNHSEPLWGSLPGSHYTQPAWYLGVNLAAFTNVSNNDAQQEGSWEGEGFIVVRLLLSVCCFSHAHGALFNYSPVQEIQSARSCLILSTRTKKATQGQMLS